jgi:cyclopropane fatty-acyl-phospholipid synthase-like methyltransferase
MGSEGAAHAIYFYTRHPISADIILKKLAAEGKDKPRPEDLFAHDQDHYGGLAANDAIAEAAEIAPGMKVADFCAGLGGPARYFAYRCGADVTGIELTPERVRGAQMLTALVGLSDRVRVIEGNVQLPSLSDASVDAVVSQEAFLHVPDKAAAIGQAFRLLKPGGRFAFTDWIVHRPLADDDAALMWEGLAAQTLQSIGRYEALLRDAGFHIVSVKDLTEEWGVILAERLAMYRKLRAEAEAHGTPSGPDAFHRAYVRFVALMQERTLGGARFAAQKPD